DLGAPAVSREGLALPLVFFEHFPALRDLEVMGQRIPLATIDTGSNAALTVGPDVAERFGGGPGPRGVALAGGAGGGGGGAVLRGQGRRVRLGPLALDGVEIDTHLGRGGDFGRSGRANIGNRLLARFAAVVLDYERHILILEPDQAP